jgi:rare lipoprotein A (peptidoglycan hydrolase)
MDAPLPWFPENIVPVLLCSRNGVSENLQKQRVLSFFVSSSAKEREGVPALVETSQGNDTEPMVRCLCLALVLLAVPALAPLHAQSDSGLAGVFPDALGGRVTASGEVYDPNSFTGGSPNLRLGMRLAVTNPVNGRVVTIRVNDGGPSPAGRVINLSRAAAEALGVKTGDRVEIRALRFDQPDVTSLPAKPSVPVAAPTPAVPAPGPVATRIPAPSPAPPAPPPAPPSTQPKFVPTPPPSAWVQMGAFRTERNAQRLAASLSREGLEPLIRREVWLFRVYLTVLDSEAPALVVRLTGLGHKGFFQLEKEPAGTAVPLSTQ